MLFLLATSITKVQYEYKNVSNFDLFCGKNYVKIKKLKSYEPLFCLHLLKNTS